MRLLFQIRLENAELQESVRDLKMKNEILISSNSQMSVNKATESKKIKDSSYEVCYAPKITKLQNLYNK